MKSDKAKKVTSREYMMKLLYQADVNKEGIENLSSILDKFLNDNLEYIVNRYEELRLQYSNNPEIGHYGTNKWKCTWKEYRTIEEVEKALLAAKEKLEQYSTKGIKYDGR